MKILIATGGTQGHIAPALFVASELQSKGHEVCLVGEFKRFYSDISDKGYSVRELKVEGDSSKNLVKRIGFFVSIVRSLFQAVIIFQEEKPDCILGFGGYASFSMVFIGSGFKCPTMIHEQNVVPGRVNSFLSRIVDKVAISFEKSSSFFFRKNTVFTGCPCSNSITKYDKKELLDKFGLNKDRITLFVFGGSQGSHKINVEFIKAVPLLKRVLDFQVIHISGDKDYLEIDNFYKSSDVTYVLYKYLEEMEEAYFLSDLVISRAGAMTVTELAKYCISAILIPYPYAHGHQKENAFILQERGIAEIIEDNELSSEKLCDMILSILKKDYKKEYLSEKIKGIWREDASAVIAEEVLKLI